MEKKPVILPLHRPHQQHHRRRTLLLFLTSLLVLTGLYINLFTASHSVKVVRVPLHAAESLEKCRALRSMPIKRAASDSERTISDRFVRGTPSVLLKNATVWTGLRGGKEVLNGVDILLDKGIIKSVASTLEGQFTTKHVIDLDGAWVTPGIVDMHSHIGVSPAPSLTATSSGGHSQKGPILPWLRSIDAINTHDDAYALSMAGGITTSLVLPGSGNAIGGQAFPIKLRPTIEKTPTSMLIEIPATLNASKTEPVWRHMKHACGENPGRVYQGSRMDTYWAFREAYNTARDIRNKQDDFCALAEAGIWKEGEEGKFPENLQWEALVDVLRGKVKVHNHCYETVDLDAMVRITNEFKFHIAAFHHSHEAYLVPGTLRKAWGGSPAIAMFATNARYKRESYRGSEFAPKILAEQGIPVVMKSDHPVLDSRYLLYEAQQAHFYGLPAELALASVTTTPASVMELDYRLGYVKEGYDADIVVWDSHPLVLGATPLHVFVDGISQLHSSSKTSLKKKPSYFQKLPRMPDFSRPAKDAVKYDGLPPLSPRRRKRVLFTNVKNVWEKNEEERKIVRRVADVETLTGQEYYSVLVSDGKIECMDISCTYPVSAQDEEIEAIDLKGGSLNPSLITYGSQAGLEEIRSEKSTNDGNVLQPLSDKIPTILDGGERASVIRAVDGLSFGGRDLLLAYRAGVTTAITAPSHSGFLAGLGTAFSVSASHKLEKGAIVQDTTALHISLHKGGDFSVSSQIATLRTLLRGHEAKGGLDKVFQNIVQGHTTLVVDVESADIIASVLSLKSEIERERLTGSEKLKVTLSGASEAHLLAKEIAEAGVGVVFRPSRPFPKSWEKSRMLQGPPLTEHSAISELIVHNVTVGIGVEELWSCRNTRFDAAWAAIDARGGLSKEETFALVSTNLETLLGVESSKSIPRDDFVVTRGGDLLSMEAEVVGVVNSAGGIVDLF